MSNSYTVIKLWIPWMVKPLLIIKPYAMKEWENGGIDLLLLNLGTRCRWASRPGPRKRAPVPRLIGCLVKPSRFRRFEERHILLSLPRIKLRFIGRPPRSIFTVPSELPRLFSDSIAIEKILECLTLLFYHKMFHSMGSVNCSVAVCVLRSTCLVTDFWNPM
jgi:hypothetical protein